MIGDLIKSFKNRADGWFSLFSGYGVPGRDKRMSVRHTADLLNDATVQDLWRGNDIAARIIETVPNECYRQGFEINAGDKELTEDVSSALEDLCTTPTFLTAKKYERAYGGAAVFPIINDGTPNLALPLNENRITQIDHLIVFEPRELQPLTYYESLFDKKFGEPKTYLLSPVMQGGATIFNQTEIHESRLIIFPGIRTSRSQTSLSHAWGDSVMCRAYQILRDYGIAWSSVAVLLHDFSQSSFKIKGLAELIASDNDDVIRKRIAAIEYSRSSINATLMDSQEEYERKQTPVSGMSELIRDFATRLAAAADMPVTLLMGQSPSGLNATGDSDIRFFYDRIAYHQVLGCTPQLERLIRLYFLSKNGVTKGKEPDNWTVKFNSLWQPSEKEIAETRQIVANTDVAYINSGVLSPEEVALSRYGGDTYSIETVVDFDARAKLQAEQEKEMKERMELEARKVELLESQQEQKLLGSGEDEEAPDDENVIDIEPEDEEKQDAETRLDFIQQRGEEYIIVSHKTGKDIKSFTNDADAKKWLQDRRSRKLGAMRQGRDDKRKTFKTMGSPGSNGVPAPIPEQSEEEEHEAIDEEDLEDNEDGIDEEE